MNFKAILPFVAVLMLGMACQAQPTITVGATTLTENVVATGLQIPWEILWGPDDHIWLTEKRGQILRLNPSNGNYTVILNHQSAVSSGSERGMLGMVLHPDFENTPKVYVVYNYSSGGIKERLSSFDWNSGTEQLSNEVILLNNIPGANIHDGSRLIITGDGKILMSTGDVGSTANAQNMNSNNGKFLRINLDGSIPADNPSASSYVYSYGHRNPQGLCQGPNGIIYSSEHGQNNSDEFNIIEENRNYGWPNVEGACNTTSEISFCNTNNVREPLAEFSPCAAVNGVEYYDHPAIPEWQNSVLMAVLGGFALSDSRLSVIHMSTDGLSITSQDEYFSNYGRLRDVCVNPYTGSVYFATNGPSYPGSGPNQIVEYRNLDYSAVGIEDNKSENQFINLSPNPMNDRMNISFSDNFIGKTYEVISYDGKQVLTNTISSPSTTITKDKLAAGNYYLRATNDEGTITKAFVVN
ncbi:MAG: glucose/arabinose dehydrogenase [Granulosicoccus sp.]|jgi:glucose/arabinose dehydrogenase